MSASGGFCHSKATTVKPQGQSDFGFRPYEGARHRAYPLSRFCGTAHFWMNVGESVLYLTVDTSHALDPVHIGVVGGGQP